MTSYLRDGPKSCQTLPRTSLYFRCYNLLKVSLCWVGVVCNLARLNQVLYLATLLASLFRGIPDSHSHRILHRDLVGNRYCTSRPYVPLVLIPLKFPRVIT